jgi:hypothetical protein
MGRKEIAEAAGASNRFLDRPVKAIDSDTGIGADLTELRRTVEALDPKENSKAFTTRKLFGIIPFGGGSIIISTSTEARRRTSRRSSRASPAARTSC